MPTNILLDKKVSSRPPPITRSTPASNDADVTPLRHLENHKSREATIHTTLYDLIAALDEIVAPDEGHAVTATVVHLLSTRRVMYTGDLRDYRLVCEPLAQPGLPRQKKNDLFSQTKRALSSFEKARGLALSLAREA